MKGIGRKFFNIFLIYKIRVSKGTYFFFFSDFLQYAPPSFQSHQYRTLSIYICQWCPKLLYIFILLPGNVNFYIINLYRNVPWQHNMFTWAAGRACGHSFRVLRKGVVLMSTYEEFMVILTIGLLIVAILNLKNK